MQIQFIYGNLMYTSPSGAKPDLIIPEPGTFHNDDRSLYSCSGRRPRLTNRSLRSIRRMDGQPFPRARPLLGFWTEPDIGYWNPWGNPEEFGGSWLRL